MSVYCRENDGRWRFRVMGYYANGSGKRISGYAPKNENTKAAAKRAEAQALALMATQLPPVKGAPEETPTTPTTPTTSAEPVKPAVPTLADFSEIYMATSRLDNRPSTIASKEGIWRTHLLPGLGHLPLDAVDYATIEDFKLKLSRTPAGRWRGVAGARRRRNGPAKPPKMLSGATINKVLQILHDTLQAARKRQLIVTVPDIDWVKVREPEVDFLTFEEAATLLAPDPGEDRAWHTMILVGLRTGLRRGELLGLRWFDVDLVGDRLTVRQNYVEGVFGPPKSGKPREVPLGQEVRGALAAHLAAQRAAGVPVDGRDALVFCEADGHVLTDGKCAYPLMRATQRAGLRPIGWHTLRHTFASHLVMRGVPLKVVQELLGHALIATTMRYAHLQSQMKHDAVRLLDIASNSVAAVATVATARNWQNPSLGSPSN